MTRDQLHIAFKIAMDKNAANVAFGSYPAFLPEEIDYWLNQGMYQEVSNKFTGLNTLEQPFEQSVKRVHDLEKLIITENSIVADKVSNINKCIVRDVFKNKMFFVDAFFRFDSGKSNIVLVKHSETDRFIQTYDNLPYIQTPVATIENNDLCIYFDPISMDADKYHIDLTYVKFPTKVENLGEAGITEFPEYMQHEIINRAVELALENIESNRIQTKSQLNKIDE